MRLFGIFNSSKSSKPMIDLDSKDLFFDKIRNYYFDIAGSSVSEDLLNKISDLLSIYFYEEYKRFRIQYPKSIKRYSTLKLSDLENPLTHDMIIYFLKKNYTNDYENICAGLFKMSLTEFKEYEKSRKDFYNMF